MKKLSFNSLFNIFLLLTYSIVCIVISYDCFTNKKAIGYGTVIICILMAIVFNFIGEKNIKDQNSLLGIAWKIVNESLIIISIIANGIMLLITNKRVLILVDIVIVMIILFWNIFMIRVNENFNEQDKE